MITMIWPFVGHSLSTYIHIQHPQLEYFIIIIDGDVVVGGRFVLFFLLLAVVVARCGCISWKDTHVHTNTLTHAHAERSRRRRIFFVWVCLLFYSFAASFTTELTVGSLSASLSLPMSFLLHSFKFCVTKPHACLSLPLPLSLSLCRFLSFDPLLLLYVAPLVSGITAFQSRFRRKKKRMVKCL